MEIYKECYPSTANYGVNDEQELISYLEEVYEMSSGSTYSADDIVLIATKSENEDIVQILIAWVHPNQRHQHIMTEVLLNLKFPHYIVLEKSNEKMFDLLLKMDGYEVRDYVIVDNQRITVDDYQIVFVKTYPLDLNDV
jgi:uncharacterized protein YrzB (UPF0473 family)